MALIEQRHPVFNELICLWRTRLHRGGPPTADLLSRDVLASFADSTATLTMDASGDRFIIVSSGVEVDALYGAALTGAPAARLSPERDDAESEARVAVETGQPLLIEDELQCAGHRRRVARLYLPMPNGGSLPPCVLCGVVALA